MPDQEPRRSSGLWRHRDFLLLWGGQSVSELGSAVTTLALPLTAVVVLNASTFQVGLLSAATTVSFLLIALPAGVVVDRIAKRRLMIGCDAARMLIIGSVPLAAALGVLTMAQLFAVAILAGVLTVFFDVAYQSYLPSLIGRAQLIDGNGKLGATQSFAQVAGPGIGSVLFGFLRAGAMTVDALSYGVSTVSLLLIRARERAPQKAANGLAGRAGWPGLREEIFAGLAFVAGHPVLRKIAACTGTSNLFSSMGGALEIIFLVRVLHVRPAYTGLLFGLGGLAGIAAGILSGPLARRIGSARIIWFSILVFGSVGLVLPLAEPGWRLALFALGVAGSFFSAVLYNIAQLTYRQSICPPALLGRMNAAIRWIVWGTLPLGGVLGGVLGTAIGIRPTLWIAVIGTYAAGLWVLFSPLRRMRDVPALDPDDDSGHPGSARPGNGRPGPADHATRHFAKEPAEPMTVIDAHHHLWDLSVREQPWLAQPGLAALRRDFLLPELEPIAHAEGVTSTVLIQTVTDAGETPEMLALAAGSDLVAGVVGWVDLAAPGRTDAICALRDLPGGAHLAGIRHPVLFEPDPHWLARPDVLRGLAAVAAAGLVFDLVVTPDHLPDAVAAAASLPELTFVLDHLGNPDVVPVVDEQWAGSVRALAALPNTVCKLSGILGVPAADAADTVSGTGPEAAGPGRHTAASVAHMRPYYQIALEEFGPDRMMYGSDWPVSTLGSPYARVIGAARLLTADLSIAERSAIFSGTARRVYDLSDPAGTPENP
jgi:predicted TIM-barrel fold metal-dependent hydrolase/MFS family permease